MIEVDTNVEVEKEEVDPRTIEDGKRVDTPEITDAPTRPEGIPDELWDMDANDVKKDELIKAYGLESKKAKDLRAIISKGIGKPAESIEDYKLELEEDYRAELPDDSPINSILRNAALEAGLTPEQLQRLVPAYLKGVREGATDIENYTSEQIKASRLSPEEQATLQEAADKKFYDEQMAILGDEGKRKMDMLGDEFSNLYKKGRITQRQLQVLQASLYDAEAIDAFGTVMLVQKGQQVIPTKHAVETGALTRDELESMQADPKFQNPEGYKKIMDGYRKLESAGML